MSFFIKMSIQLKLQLVFSILIILIIGIISFFTIKKSEESLTKEIGRNFQVQATLTMQKIDNSLFERYGDAQSFASNDLAIKKLEGKDVDLELQSYFNKIMPIYGCYDLMILVDINGKIIKTNTVKSDGSPFQESLAIIGKDKSKSKWFQKIISGEIKKGFSYYSDSHKDKYVSELYNTQEPILDFASGVYNKENKLLGMWVNYIRLNNIVGAISKPTFDYNKSIGIKSYQLLIIDKNQNLLIDSRITKDMSDFNFNNKLNSLNLALSGKDTFEVERNTRTNVLLVDGASLSKGVGDFKGNNWVCLTRVDAKEAFASISELKTFLLILGVVLVLLSIFLVYLIALNIKNGILKVNENIFKITTGIVNGELSTRANTNEVGVDFKNLTSNINNLIDAFVAPINVTAEYVDRISKGDLPPIIVDDYKGDFNEIKSNIN
ncbi:MAG: hypothetical protein NTW25_15830, partial [Candidatus Kapabacteria bacterium]|nr:hypothetical protein [Candidatus Kapabacteria bacterium]